MELLSDILLRNLYVFTADPFFGAYGCGCACVSMHLAWDILNIWCC